MAAEFYSPADQLIYKDNQFIPQEQYRLGPYPNIPEGEEEVTQGSGIPYTGAFTNSGGSSNYYPGPTKHLIRDFETATTDRQAQLNAGEIKTLPGMNQPQSYEDIMDKGYRTTGRVMPGIIGLMNKFGIQNFAGLPQADQAFIASQSGYTGPTVFGDQGGMGHSVDPFGKNIESLAGNYAEYVSDRVAKLEDIVANQRNRKVPLKNTIQMKQLKFYRGKKKEREGIESDLVRRHQAEAAFAGRGGDEGARAKQAAADKATVAQANRDYRDNPDRYSGGEHRADESGSTYSDPFDPGGGEKEGGFIDGSNRRAGYRGGQLVRPGPGRPGYQGSMPPGVHGKETGGGYSDKERHERRQNVGGGDNIVIPPKDNLTVDTNLMSTEPSVELNYSPSELANIRARLYNQDITSEDDINLEGQISGAIGPVDYSTQFTDQGIGDTSINYNNLSALIDANKNIENISFNKDIGNFNLRANTDLDNYNFGIDYNQGPFFAGATTDNMGNRNFNVGAKWEFGQPERPSNVLSWQDENPDLIYGQNLRYGGLAGIL